MMTSEKAIQLLHRLQDEQFDGIHGDERLEALSMAVRALEGDGDTISRKMAIDAVVSAMIDGADAELVEGVMELLPSAQSKRKKGKCIWCDSPFRIEYNWIDRYGNTASFQDEERHIVATGIAKFCPNCGARMEGESDDN